MIVAESKNPNPASSSFEKAAYAAMTLHYASIYYDRRYGRGEWPLVAPFFLGRQYKKAWRTIKLERQDAA